MQLRVKLILLAVGSVAATMLAVFALLSGELAGGEVELTPDLVQFQHNRILSRIRDDQNRALAVAEDLARSGLVFGYEQPADQAERVSDLLAKSGLQVALAVDRRSGQISIISDLDPIEADDLVEASATAALAIRNARSGPAAGFLPTSMSLYFMASADVVASDMSVVVLKELDLTEGPGPVGLLAKVDRIVPISSSDPSHRAALAKLRAGNKIVITQLDQEFDTFGLVESALGEQLLIQVKVPRYGLLIAREGIMHFIPLAILCGAFIAIAFALWLILVVARPLTTILHYGDSTLEPNHRDVAEQMKRGDEFGGLARLVRRLRDSVIRAEETSRRHGYRSGMEEMASAILHNVGNTLTPVVVRVDRILETLRRDSTADIGAAAREIANPDTPPERKEKLVRYFELLHERFQNRDVELNDDLTQISAQVVRVEEMLSSGELLGNDMGVIESFEMESVIRAAISAVPMKLQGIASVDVASNLASCDPIRGSKLELIQVVLNILCNASESIEKRGNRDGRIDISARQTVENDVPSLHLTFSDNGMGVKREQMPFIFEKGFSTKQGRRGGNGLDWCARTIAKLQGRIYAESDGAGKGVAFHLVLPIDHTIVEPAAQTEVNLQVVA